MTRTAWLLLRLVLLVLCTAAPAFAQYDEPEDESPAFGLTSSEVFTTQDSASFYLTHRRLSQLDFRIYKVRDARTFFTGLSNLHQLGSWSSGVQVPIEKTWLERLTDWKREHRRQIRAFVRDQVSWEYRDARREVRDRQDAARRVVLNKSSFAQVPLLNPEQLVTAWREMLPNVADAEIRQMPLDIKAPGIYVVEAVSGALRAYTLVMISDIGLVTKAAANRLLVFAADRQGGEPRAGCNVEAFADGQVVASGATDADGLIQFDISAEPSDRILTLATCGSEVVVSDPGGFLRGSARDLVGYVYTDKPIYRPGHTVNVKGILRWRNGDALERFDGKSVELQIADSADKVMLRRTLTPDEFGAAAGSMMLPADAALGSYSVRFVSGESQAHGSFEVQEYRRPEFEVIVTPESKFVVQGKRDAVASVRARYYFGQPVANAIVRYQVARSTYESRLLWDFGDEYGGEYEGSGYADEEQTQGEIRLDAEGLGEIRIPTELQDQDYSLIVTARVMDASSREVSESATIHATRASYLMTSRVEGSSLARAGQDVTLSIRALEYTGTPKPGVASSVELRHAAWPNGYGGTAKYTSMGSRPVTTDAQGNGAVTMTIGREPGSYEFIVTAGEDGRKISTSSSVWVPGAAEAISDGDRYLEIVADRSSYAPGDTARLLVRGDTVSGPVLLTKEGRGIGWRRLVRAVPGEPLDVPIEATDAGDVFVNIVYLRGGRLHSGQRRLTVPATERTLQVTVTAEAAVARPQQNGMFTVRVTDASGAPVRAQVSLGAIDEAVYAIANDQTPDPVRLFYQREYSGVGTSFSRDYYFHGYAGADRLQLAGRRRRPFTLADFKGDPEGRPQVRKDFPDAIYWIADLVTDRTGTARVSLRYPDALTTWRLTARAVTVDTKLGSTIARTTTTKDLIVRVITPRFLTQGDEVVLPTVVHNYLTGEQATTISFAAKGLQPSSGAAPTPVTASIAAKGERRDDWRYAAVDAGTATVTGTARTAAESDAVELSIPVLPRGLRRESGSSGSLAQPGEASASVTIPAASNPAGRAVRVSLAPSLAGSMLGALDYLTAFPYGCTEQTISTFLPNLTVSRALNQLSLVPAERLSLLGRQTADGLKRLLEMQKEDGGWGWWQTDDTHPFMTAYALYALTEARREGIDVPQEPLDRAVQALNTLYTEYPRAVPDLKAYMAFALARAEDVERTRTRLGELWDARQRMSAYGRALLLMTLDAASDPRGAQLATALVAEAETTGELSFWRSDEDRLLFDFVDTSVEATATAVRALASRDPQNPVLDRAVRWLMLQRTAGYWVSTKQTAMTLYGLLELLRARKETPQTFTADVYVNDALAGSHTFTPASLASPDPIVITAAGRAGANSVRIVKRGGGTLHWSATEVHYDIQAAEARSGTRQLAVSRKYALLAPTRLADGRIEYREQPLRGPIQPGDVLSVRLTIAGSSDWRFLLLEDPLPAGVEALQDTTGYSVPDAGGWYYGSRVEYRDARTVFFQSDMSRGRYEFVYLVKAISSGVFNATPAQVVPMYVPGIAASSEPMTVTIAVPGAEAR